MKITKQVKKRDGRVVPFNYKYISNAIGKAVEATGWAENVNVTHVVTRVEEEIKADKADVITVEHIQDLVEKYLMKGGYTITAKAYILYRKERTDMREQGSDLLHLLHTIMNVDAENSDMKRENANIDADSAMGTMLKIGTETSKYYNTLRVLPKDMAAHHTIGDYHVHDYDFLKLTTTCCQIDLLDKLKNGFSTGHGFLRQPQSIGAAAALACILVQANQNDQHGGQSIFALDYGLAPFVSMSYIDAVCDITAFAMLNTPTDFSYICKKYKKRVFTHNVMSDEPEYVKFWEEIRHKVPDLTDEQVMRIRELAIERTERATNQALEALVHNLNTMHSRAGAQVPFSSVNFGTCTTIEGRQVIMSLLRAIDAGLGMGETSIFPVAIFKVKDGINFKEGDPNYDCFKYACEVSAHRLFPNFAFIDAPFNLQFYREGHPETEVSYMGCRTRVMANHYDPTREIVARRGNLSFTSINLPRLGLKARAYAQSTHSDKEECIRYFYELLDNMLDETVKQLDFRFEIIAKKKVRNFPILMQQGVWIDSEKLNVDDEVREVLKHGTMSIGFIGLAECLVALIGKHHGESEEAQELGLALVKRMRDYTENLSNERHLNYSLLATPAEGLSGTFLRKDRKMFGIVEGVTDKEYYTNSNHIPVGFKISATKKIALEAPYHALTDAGHICYVELDGKLADNPEALMSIVRYMKEQGVGYGAINHPVDRDPCCGYVGVIDDVCPRCGRREGESMSEAKWNEIQHGRYVNAAYGTQLKEQ